MAKISDDLLNSVLGSSSSSSSSLSNKKSITDVFSDSQEQKLQSIQDSINDIEVMIKEREKLSDNVIVEIEGLTTQVDKVLNKIDGFSADVTAHTDIRREMLKKKFDLIEAKTNEKLQLWRDIATLKKELREHYKELREMQTKGSFLDSLTDM